MKTQELIALIAEDATPVRHRSMAPRLIGAALSGAVISAAILVVWLGLRPMGPAMHSPSFWMKAAYGALIATAGMLTTVRLARPGGRIDAAVGLALAAAAWLAALAALETVRTAAPGMAQLWLGDSWYVCPFRILALATPVFAAMLWWLRSMAPTRLALAGAAAGVCAGGVGAMVYGLYCEETTAAFVVIWYSLGMAGCAALGAAIGARLLRW